MTVPADRRLIGGADIGALLGISPFATAADVWLRIVHGEQRQVANVANHGTLMEPGLFALIQDAAPGKYQTHPTLRHPIFEHGVGHLDLLRKEPTKAVVDAKMIHWTQRERWDNGVPDHVRTQIDWYGQCAGTDRNYVGAFFGLGDFRMIEVEPLDADTRGSILEVVKRFWVDHIETGEPPPPDGSAGAAAVLERLHPKDGASCALDEQIAALAREFMALKQESKRVDERMEEVKQRIQHWMSEQGATFAEDGPLRVRWSEVETRRIDWPALARELGATDADAERFAKISTSHRFEVKGARQ